MSRLMLRWPMAAKAPRTIEPMEASQITCCHCPATSPKGPASTRVRSATAAIFGAAAKKAVTGVGAPS